MLRPGLQSRGKIMQELKQLQLLKADETRVAKRGFSKVRHASS